jgi:hypothetical protein
MRSNDPNNTTTSFVVNKEDLKLLKAVAYARALEHGGKPSVSNVLADVLERERDWLREQASWK